MQLQYSITYGNNNHFVYKLEVYKRMAKLYRRHIADNGTKGEIFWVELSAHIVFKSHWTDIVRELVEKRKKCLDWALEDMK